MNDLHGYRYVNCVNVTPLCLVAVGKSCRSQKIFGTMKLRCMILYCITAALCFSFIASAAVVVEQLSPQAKTNSSNNISSHCEDFFGIPLSTYREDVVVHTEESISFPSSISTDSRPPPVIKSTSLHHEPPHLSSPSSQSFSSSSVSKTDPRLHIPYFMYEQWIAAISILFFRVTVRVGSGTSIGGNNDRTQHQSRQQQRSQWLLFVLRWFFALLLATLAYQKKSYVLIMAVEMFSYMIVPLFSASFMTTTIATTRTTTTTNIISSYSKLINILSSIVPPPPIQQLLLVPFCALISFGLSHLAASITFWNSLFHWTPTIVHTTLHYLFPIHEYMKMYQVISAFTPLKQDLHQQLYHLVFVTFHIQVAMGYLGINFLQEEQARRNQLIRLDVDDNQNIIRHQQDETNDQNEQSSNSLNGKETIASKTKVTSNITTSNVNGIVDSESQQRKEKVARATVFQRSAAPFILFTAMPYMLQIITFGNMNKFAFNCVSHELHRRVRLKQLFSSDQHFLSLAMESPVSPEGK
jgi:hypothetical protein